MALVVYCHISKLLVIPVFPFFLLLTACLAVGRASQSLEIFDLRAQVFHERHQSVIATTATISAALPTLITALCKNRFELIEERCQIC